MKRKPMASLQYLNNRRLTIAVYNHCCQVLIIQVGDGFYGIDSEIPLRHPLLSNSSRLHNRNVRVIFAMTEFGNAGNRSAILLYQFRFVPTSEPISWRKSGAGKLHSIMWHRPVRPSCPTLPFIFVTAHYTGYNHFIRVVLDL